MPDSSNPDSHQQIIAIPHRSLEEQLEELVLDPLNCLQSMSQTAFPQPMIVVIDGLDEYDPHIGRVLSEDLVQLLVYASQKALFRLLLTNRPEAYIRDTFYTSALHMAVKTFPFITMSLITYTTKWRPFVKRKLPQSWPSNEGFWRISRQPEGIFVYASTLVEFVNDGKKDAMRMLQIAMNTNNGLDSIFEQVLHHAEQCDNFGLVLGAVVFLRDDPHINLLPPLLRLDTGGEQGLVMTMAHAQWEMGQKAMMTHMKTNEKGLGFDQRKQTARDRGFGRGGRNWSRTRTFLGGPLAITTRGRARVATIAANTLTWDVVVMTQTK